MLGHHVLRGRLPSVLLGPSGLDQLVGRGQVVGVVDLLVGDVPPLPEDRLLVRLLAMGPLFTSEALNEYHLQLYHCHCLIS